MTDTILDFMDDFKERMSPELIRIQEEMYFLGKKDMLQYLLHFLEVFPDSFITKANLIQTLKEVLAKIENDKNEKQI